MNTYDEVVRQLDGRGNDEVIGLAIQFVEVEAYTIAEAVAEALIHYGFEEVMS
jgi:hypothetical protein